MLVGVLRTIPAFRPARRRRVLLEAAGRRGVRPQLDVCVRCGEPEPLVAFDLDEGGVLCRTCRSGSPGTPWP